MLKLLSWFECLLCLGEMLLKSTIYILRFCIAFFTHPFLPGLELVTFVAALLNRYLWHVYLNYLTLWLSRHITPLEVDALRSALLQTKFSALHSAPLPYCLISLESMPMPMTMLMLLLRLLWQAGGFCLLNHFLCVAVCWRLTGQGL